MSSMIRTCSEYDCSSCPAWDQTLFATLSHSERDNVINGARCRQYVRGEIIYFAESRPTGVYCVRTGKVKVYKAGADGREQITHMARPGDMLGYRSLIGGDTYSDYATPIETSLICHVPGSVVFSLLSTSPTFSTAIMRLLSMELKQAENRIVELAQKSVRQRLAEALVMLANTYGVAGDGHTLNVTLTRTEIANFVGTATESVSRLLSAMREEGVIDVDGRRIVIVDPQALTEIAEVRD